MKNINEQIERIKQLFTEERLHGNLVDDENTIEEQDMWKRGRKASEMTKDAKRKKDSFRSDEEEEEFKKEFEKESERIERFYKKDRKAFKRKYTYIEPNEYGDYKLFSHKDGVGDGKTIKLVKFPKGEKSTDFNIKEAKGLLVKYLDKKLNLEKGSYEITQLHPKEDVNNSSYVVFSYIPNAIVSKGNSKTSAAKDSKDVKDTEKKAAASEKKAAASEKKAAASEKKATASEKKADAAEKETDDIKNTEKKSKYKVGITDEDTKEVKVKYAVPNGNVIKTETMTDEDISKVKKKLGIERIDTIVYLKDKGKIVVTDGDYKEYEWVTESKLTKKYLLEISNTIDINNMILEQDFKDNEGNVVDFSFVSKTQKDPKGEVKVPKGWDKFPCVYNNPNGKLEKNSENGSISFVIDGIKFYNNGRCYDLKTKEKRNYKCNGDDIDIEDTKKAVEKPIDTTEKEIAFEWYSGSPGKLKVVGNHLSNLVGIQNFLDGMVDSLDPTVIERDTKELLKNINLIKDIKLKKRMDYHGVTQKTSAPNYCKGSCSKYFWWQIPENEEGSLLSALLKAYKKDESGDTVSGDIEELINNPKLIASNTEERRKILQDILNIVKNY